jgi:hypothetical protein
MQALLQPYDVLCPHGIRTPQRLIKILTVPTAEFRCTVKDIVEWAELLKHSLDLPKIAHVTPRVEWPAISGQAARRLPNASSAFARASVVMISAFLGPAMWTYSASS